MASLSKDPEKRARQLANLRPWNETGASKAPRTNKVTMHLRNLLKREVIKSSITEAFVKEHCPTASNAEAIAITLLLKAMQGNLPAIREVLDRTEGKAIQQIELTGADGGPIDVTSTTRAAIISKLIPESTSQGEAVASSKTD